MSATTRRWLRGAALAGAFVLLAAPSSCFGPPVVEGLRIEVLPGGRTRVTARVDLASDESRNPRVAARLREWRQSLAGGFDPWSQRFERVVAEEDQLVWKRQKGALVAVERSALLAEPEALAGLLGDAPLTLAFDRRPGEADLAFYPGNATRAGRGERRRVEAGLAAWSGVLARYLQAMARLHDTAGGDAERERALLTVLFGDADAARAVELDESERQAIAAVEASMEGLIDVLAIADGEAYSLEELSQLVFDPFPAPLEVHVAGEVTGVEGFVAGARGGYLVPGLSLWRALATLPERWPALLPFAELAASGSAEERELAVDYDRLAAGLAASAPPPDAREMADALEAALRPAPVYRLIWRPVAPTSDGQAPPGP